MSAPSDPRRATPGAPSTQELPVVPRTPAEPQAAGAHRAGALPAPGQLPTQHAVPPPAAPPVPPPTPPPSGGPDPLAADAAPPTRPVTVADLDPDGSAAGGTPGFAPTGPVDFVPGLPGAGSAEPEPESQRRRLRLPAAAVPDRSVLAGLGLAALSVVVLQLGLAQDDGRLWSAVTLWSAFATAATVLGLVALGARVVAPTRVSAGAATRLAGAAVLALAVFWVLVVLPMVASDPGFLVTAALLALGGALWVGPAHER